MTAEKIKKQEKEGLELYRPAGHLTPFERMEEMFDEFFRRPFGQAVWPAVPRIFERTEPVPMVDIYEEGDAVILSSELPGMTKDDIEITLTDDRVTLAGEKKKEEKTEKKDYYRLERTYGSFKRTIRLPAEVQTDKAKASFKDGVLKIRIPKTEAAKRKEHKIKIE